jgi:hypothetical protein
MWYTFEFLFPTTPSASVMPVPFRHYQGFPPSARLVVGPPGRRFPATYAMAVLRPAAWPLIMGAPSGQAG